MTTTAPPLPERIRELFHYDPRTGIFTRRVAVRNARVGSVAGCEDSKGYLRFRIDGKTYKAHRVAWLYVTGYWPMGQIDHIDGNPANNRWSNLRDVAQNINQQNRHRTDARSTHGFLGVAKSGGYFQAKISVNGKRINIGRFKTPEAAHAAYINAKRVLHPEAFVSRAMGSTTSGEAP